MNPVTASLVDGSPAMTDMARCQLGWVTTSGGRSRPLTGKSTTSSVVPANSTLDASTPAGVRDWADSPAGRGGQTGAGPAVGAGAGTCRWTAGTAWRCWTTWVSSCASNARPPGVSGVKAPAPKTMCRPSV